MKNFTVIITFLVLALSHLPAQETYKIEFSTAFPYQGFQNSPREYFLTTQYLAGYSVTITSFAEMLNTITFTQQNPIHTQQRTHYGTRPQVGNDFSFVPFTTDPFYNEYGFFSGVRLSTLQNVAQVFLKGQIGFTGTKYGRIEQHLYHYTEPFPGGPSYKQVEGSVMKIQFAALYGGGVTFNIMNSISFVFDIHVVNHFVDQPLDVYQSVGLNFGI